MRLGPLAKLIQYRLDEMNITWEELSRRLDISSSMTSHIKLGRRTFGLEQVYRLSDALKIPVSDIIYAQSVQKGEFSVSMNTPSKRSTALALLRIWESSTDEQLGKIYQLAESIHIEQVN